MTWKWPDANNLSYYEALARNTTVLDEVVILATIKSKDFCIGTVTFSYKIVIEHLYHNLRFELHLDSDTNHGSEAIGILMQLSMAQHVAELHASQNFVNP